MTQPAAAPYGKSHAGQVRPTYSGTVLRKYSAFREKVTFGPASPSRRSEPPGRCRRRSFATTRALAEALSPRLVV